MPKLRTAIIGLGMMGTNHARVLSNLEGVELVAVADPQGYAQKVLPQIKVLNSVDEVIKLGVDYCVISAPTAFHEEIALQLIANGIHFLVEKPIADTYVSAVKIRDAAQAAKVIGAVGHIERFNSALQEARKRVLAGELGTIYQVATRRQGPFPSRISDVGVVIAEDLLEVEWRTCEDCFVFSAV
jgi:predicted dehydrogenase